MVFVVLLLPPLLHPHALQLLSSDQAQSSVLRLTHSGRFCGQTSVQAVILTIEETEWKQGFLKSMWQSHDSPKKKCRFKLVRVQQLDRDTDLVFFFFFKPNNKGKKKGRMRMALQMSKLKAEKSWLDTFLRRAYWIWKAAFYILTFSRVKEKAISSF